MSAVLQVIVRPALGPEEELRVTLPAKLNLLVKVRKMEDPVAPELRLTEAVAEMVKSPTCTAMVVE